MDTDIIAGIDTALVLSGITQESDLQRYAYRPRYILQDVRESAKKHGRRRRMEWWNDG